MEFIPNLQRARLFVYAENIQLFDYSIYKQALSLFNRAKDLFPDDIKVSSGFGNYYLKIGEVEKAKDDFQHIISVNPNSIEGYIGMGDCYQSQEDVSNAEEYYQTAIIKASGWSEGYRRLFTLYGRPESFNTHEEEILSLSERAVSVDPQNEYDIYLDLGSVYQQNRHYVEAHKLFQKAIDLDNTRVGDMVPTVIAI